LSLAKGRHISINKGKNSLQHKDYDGRIEYNNIFTKEIKLGT